MSTIQVQVMSGPTKGRRYAFEQSPVRFGREQDNQVMLATPHVSRQHGELIFDDGQWMIVNHSANGTLLNGKKVRKPMRVQTGDIVSIGDEQMFRVVIQVDDMPPAELDDEPPAEGEGEGRSKGRSLIKNRLPLIVFLMSCVVLMIMIAIASVQESGQGDGASLDDIDQLTAAQIEREIRTPPDVADRLPAAALEHLQDARQLGQRTDSSPDALYRAHRNYQLALAYSGRTTYEDNIDTLRADEIKRELIDKVTELYRTGYAQVRSRQYREGLETLNKLTTIYPDPNSIIHKNAEAQKRVANKQLNKR